MTGIETQIELLLLVAFASVLGGIIGYEREVDGHSAGLRTHMFISATSSALVLLGTHLASLYSITLHTPIQSDPLRIVEAIIVGIGFVGAGVILKEEKQHRVKNLTTAASILFTAVIGITVGIKFYILAIGLTVIALIVNFMLLQVEKKIHPEKRGFFGM
jgi:putative Mg2+ transporter-C (MgtC) family protein